MSKISINSTSLFESAHYLLCFFSASVIGICMLLVLLFIFTTLIRNKKKNSTLSTSRAWVELNMGNLRHNIKILLDFLPAGCELMPAVKANAYGHGVAEISKELSAIGIKAFCVASVSEGVFLRRNGIPGEILILGYTHPSHFYLLNKFRLIQTVVDCCYAQALNKYGKKIKVHIKIDTGMHRLGERCENTSEIMQMFQYKNLKIIGIYTHLCADDSYLKSNENFTNQQINSFYKVLALIKSQGFTDLKVHIQSSYGVLAHPELVCDYARVGIAIFGMLCSIEDTERRNIGLCPVLSLKARISAVKPVFAGEPAGYGLQFVAPHDMLIAVVSIGYSDGIPRNLSSCGGNVLIHGEKAPIVGRICMDQLLIDITNIPNASQGDIAVIVGQSSNSEISICEIAKQTGTISNEILSRLGGRLDRLVLSGTHTTY